MSIRTRKQMEKALKENVCEVFFAKVDGTERVMYCTLIPDYVPKVISETPIKKNDDVIRVFDTEKEGWRSFRVDSVTYFGEFKTKKEVDQSPEYIHMLVS